MTDDGRQARHDEAALAHFEKRLLEERRLVLRELAERGDTLGATQQERDGDLSNYRFHMADQGTDAMEQEKNMLLASQEGRLLWQIDEALRHLYRSPATFGTCRQCERLIAFERLDTIPHARLCITCKQGAESRASARADTSTDTSTDAGAETSADVSPA